MTTNLIPCKIPISELTIIIMVESNTKEELNQIEDFAYEFLDDYTKPEFKCILEMIEVKTKMI